MHLPCNRCFKGPTVDMILFNVYHVTLCQPRLNEWELFARKQEFWKIDRELEAQRLYYSLNKDHISYGDIQYNFDSMDNNRLAAYPIIAGWVHGQAKYRRGQVED